MPVPTALGWVGGGGYQEEVCSATALWVNEVARILPCTCGRATLDARRLLLLISGDVERNPGPPMRVAQWNSGVSPSKRVPGEELREDMVLLCLLQETPWVGGVCRAKNRRMPARGQARTPHGAGHRFWL
ncbi:hypothetical protein ERJ75_001428700 [Trypanosoma vivax]|nr:hypothetical protein ERJ75_001428700 [Trypanosoma vivax]